MARRSGPSGRGIVRTVHPDASKFVMLLTIPSAVDLFGKRFALVTLTKPACCRKSVPSARSSSTNPVFVLTSTALRLFAVQLGTISMVRGELAVVPTFALVQFLEGSNSFT